MKRFFIPLYPFKDDPDTRNSNNVFMNDEPGQQTGKPETEPGLHTLVLVTGMQHNIADGCEFLDDAIRSFDQPLGQSGYPEEKAAI